MFGKFVTTQYNVGLTKCVGILHGVSDVDHAANLIGSFHDRYLRFVLVDAVISISTSFQVSVDKKAY